MSDEELYPDNIKVAAKADVTLQFPAPPLAKRFLAFFIDALIACLPAAILSAIALAPYVYMMLVMPLPAIYENEVFYYAALLIAFPLSVIWLLAYSLCRDGFRGKQSLGKSLCGLAVIHLKEKRPCRPGESIARNSLFMVLALVNFFIPLLLGLPVLVESIAILRSPRGQRISDHWSDTQVIEAKLLSRVSRGRGC